MGRMIAKIAVSRAIYAIDRPYDYRVPPELEDRLRPGMRVLVPFGSGNRGTDGMVLSLTREEDHKPGRKDIQALLDDTPVISPLGIRLALWMRERYFCTVYDCVTSNHIDLLFLQSQLLPAFQGDKESHHPVVLKCHKTQTGFLNDFADTQTAGFQTQLVPYIEMQFLHMLKQPE